MEDNKEKEMDDDLEVKKDKAIEELEKNDENVIDESENNNEKASDELDHEEVNKTKKNKSGKGIKIIIGIVVLLIICVTIELFTDFFSKSFFKVKETYLKSNRIIEGTGNTVGNIRNYGYLVTDDEYVYYMCPNTISSAMGIRKLSINDLTGKPEVLIEGGWDITGLNYIDGYLYFVTFADNIDMDEFLDDDEVVSENEDTEEIETDENTDAVDNKIHRMKVDGSEHTIINDNEFNNDCYEIYVIDDKIYYIGEDACIYYMDLDGKNKTKLNDDGCGFVGVTQKYIFYNLIEETEETESIDENEELQYSTYMMNIDGTDAHPIIEDGKMFNINVVGDYIYYVDSNRYIFRVNIDGTDNTMISDQTAYNMNVTDEGIFYYNYYQVDGTNAGVALYRMDLDGKNVTELVKLESHSETLCEFDNWLFLTDNNETIGKFLLISKDGKQTIELYKLDLSRLMTFTKTSEDSESSEEVE